MSFILEALKKSEQQRQEQNMPQQKKVRNRTLTFTSSRSARRSSWLLAALLPLLLLGGGWWLYNEMNPTPEPIPELSLEKSALSETSLPKETEPAVANPVPVANDLRQPTVVAKEAPVLAAEAAPVPSIYVSVPAVPARSPSTQQQRLTRQADVAADAEINADEAVATVVFDQSQPVDNLSLEPGTSQMPRYSDLSRDMRERMSPLAMSMHFYNGEPNRRLVRINDQLLREGDWVNRDLELVEITPRGVILDFLGTAFELHGSKR